MVFRPPPQKNENCVSVPIFLDLTAKEKRSSITTRKRGWSEFHTIQDVDSLHFLDKRKTFCQKCRKLLMSCPSQAVSQTPRNYFISSFFDLVDNCSAAAEKFLMEERLSEPWNIRGLLQPHWSLNSLPLFSLPVPLFLADSLSPGEADERVLVPEPLCKADGPAHQEDAGQDSQLSGEGQRVVRRTFGGGGETFSLIFLGAAVGWRGSAPSLRARP